MVDFNAFSPKSFQFWANPTIRLKRVFEAVLFFPDLIFGGDGLQNLESFLVKSFSRPGYNKIETKTAEYQLRSGDFAKIDYPTQGFTTKPLNVTLVDTAGFGSRGADTAAIVNASLALVQKTMVFEKEARSHQPGDGSESKWTNMIDACREYPKMFQIMELDGKGGILGTWEIYRPVLTSTQFSDINYDGASLATVTMTFNYQNFRLDQSWGERLLNDRLDRIKKGTVTPIADAFKGGKEWWGSNVGGWTKKL